MKFLGMGPLEFAIIIAIILIIFGPKQLPKLGRAIGKTVKNLKSSIGGDKEEAAQETEAPAEEPQAKKPVASLTAAEVEVVVEAPAEAKPTVVKKTVVKKKVQ